MVWCTGWTAASVLARDQGRRIDGGWPVTRTSSRTGVRVPLRCAQRPRVQSQPEGLGRLVTAPGPRPDLDGSTSGRGRDGVVPSTVALFHSRTCLCAPESVSSWLELSFDAAGVRPYLLDHGDVGILRSTNRRLEVSGASSHGRMIHWRRKVLTIRVRPPCCHTTAQAGAGMIPGHLAEVLVELGRKPPRPAPGRIVAAGR